MNFTRQFSETAEPVHGTVSACIAAGYTSTIRYARTEAVLLNAYTNTPLGTDGAVLVNRGGFEQTVMRRTEMTLYFDANGMLYTYRLERSRP